MNKFTLHHIAREPRKGSLETGERPPLLVLLHGVRSNEQDLFGLAPMLDERFYVVSAQAPIAMGPGGYGWYHVEFTPTGFVIDEAEAERSLQMLLRFVDELKAAYPVDPSQVYLMGFSQGCIVGLSAALTIPKKIAGVVGMSGRLIPSSTAHLAPEADLKGLPVMVVHGTQDQVIPISDGRQIRETLQHLPVDLTYREYQMGHSVTPESLADISDWLTARLNLAITVS
ncbi:MAG: dienelactone hydrolase family protein [Bryobacteraceae bacterium]|nr:dienelactone hydrolase family protein [Bryobacteraceae bacterium]